MISRFSSALIAFLLVVSTAVQAQFSQIKVRMEHPDSLVIASHRAAHAVYPENSLKAIEEAIRLGVDIIEIDVKVSSDGVPFLLHDETLNRTAVSARGPLETMTAEQLRKVRLKNTDDSESDQFIPTLEEALKVANGKVYVDLDLKTEKVELLVPIIKALEMEDQVFFFDSDWEVLDHVRSLMPEAQLMPRARSVTDIYKIEKRFAPAMVHIDPSFYTKKSIKAANKFEMKMWINSLGESDRKLNANPDSKLADALVGPGARMVQTDVVDFWVEYRGTVNGK
jgi:glycerophosphoryl diester phosphodiesterase